MNKINVFIIANNFPQTGAGGGATIAGLLYDSFRSDNEIEVKGVFGKSIICHPDVPWRNLLNYKYNSIQLHSRWYYTYGKFPVYALKLVRDKFNSINLANKIESQIRNKSVASVLHAHDNYSASLLFPRREFKDITKIYTIHSKGDLASELIKQYPTLSNSLLEFQFKQYETLAVKYTDVITFPSNGARELFLEARPDLTQYIENKTSIIYNGIKDNFSKYSQELKNFQNHHTYTLLNIAQHVPEKGIDKIIEALHILKNRYNRVVKVVNCGSQTILSTQLQELVKRKGVEDLIEWRGRMSHEDTLKLLANCDIFISTPNVAVFDIALLEAMSLSKPVIATPVGGNLEALGNHYEYYADTPEKISQQILGFLEQDSEKIKEVGKRNRERFLEKFTLTLMINSYKQTYINIV